MKNFGNRLRELRKEKGITIQELANRVGVAKSAVSFWENDTYEPKATYIATLAKILNVSTDFLLGIEDEYGNKIDQETPVKPVKIPFRINAARSKDNKFRDTVIYLTQEQYNEIMKICEKESDELDF